MKKHFEKIKSEGACIHRLDEELIRRRREELRSAPTPFSPSPTSVSLSSGNLKRLLSKRQEHKVLPKAGRVRGAGGELANGCCYK